MNVQSLVIHVINTRSLIFLFFLCVCGEGLGTRLLLHMMHARLSAIATAGHDGLVIVWDILAGVQIQRFLTEVGCPCSLMTSLLHCHDISTAL